MPSEQHQTTSTLTHKHRYELEIGSGIPWDLIEEEGICSLRDVCELPPVSETLRHPNPEKGRRFGRLPKVDSGIMFPFHDETGAVVTWQYKPDHPRRVDGSTIKYETPIGSRLTLYVPRRVRPLLRDRTQELWVTEGVKKTLSGAGAGLCIVGLAGVDAWRVRHGADDSRPFPEWDLVELGGRIVLIAFDSDAATKPEVQAAERRLATFLRSRGATVVIVRIPPATDGSKQGLDDFIAAGEDVQVLRTDALVAALNSGPKIGTDGAQTCRRCGPLRAEKTDLHAEVGRLQEREAGMVELRASPMWSGKQRQVVEHLAYVAQEARKEGLAEVKLYLPREGKRSGTSAATVSTVATKLRELQPEQLPEGVALPFEIARDTDQDTGHTILKMTNIVQDSHPGRDIAILARIKRPEELGQHGGKRVRRCCPGASVILRQTWSCSRCRMPVAPPEESSPPVVYIDDDQTSFQLETTSEDVLPVEETQTLSAPPSRPVSPPPINTGKSKRATSFQLETGSALPCVRSGCPLPATNGFVCAPHLAGVEEEAAALLRPGGAE